MTTDGSKELISFGLEIINILYPVDATQLNLKNRLLQYHHGGFLGLEDEAGWVSCVLALSSVVSGNYGIGALIIDKDGKIVVSGHNEICHPYFRSDAHAEMVVISKFESKFKNRTKDGLSLYTSLEPCPMCYTRILTSGIPSIFHVANDDPGGMVQRAEVLPIYWRSMAKKHTFSKLKAREELRSISLDILNSNISTLDDSLRLRPI